jgi:SnoaL-like protein
MDPDDDFGSIEDRMRIEDVWARYAILLDAADPRVSSLFTEDAVFDVAGLVFTGRGQIEQFAMMTAGPFGLHDREPVDDLGRKFLPLRHVLSNLVIDLRGDTATADSYWTELLSSGRDPSGVGRPPTVLNAGRYRDAFVKRDGRWLISERRVIADVYQQVPQEILDMLPGPFPDNQGPTPQSP